MLTAEIGEPDVGWGEIESGDGIESYVPDLFTGFHLEFGEALDARLAFGEQSDLSSILKSGVGEERDLGWASGEGRVVGRSGDLLVAMFGGVLPARSAGFERIVLVYGRLQIVVASDDFRDGNSVRVEFQDAGGFGTTSAIVELKKYMEGAIGGGPIGFLSGNAPHQQQRVALGGGGDVGGKGGSGGGRRLLREEGEGEKDRED